MFGFPEVLTVSFINDLLAAATTNEQKKDLKKIRSLIGKGCKLKGNVPGSNIFRIINQINVSMIDVD